MIVLVYDGGEPGAVTISALLVWYSRCSSANLAAIVLIVGLAWPSLAII